MIGLINNICLDYISNRFGDEVLNQVLSESGAPQQEFVSSCPYSDSVTAKILRTLSSLCGRSENEIGEDFGGFFVSYISLNGYEKV